MEKKVVNLKDFGSGENFMKHIRENHWSLSGRG